MHVVNKKNCIALAIFILGIAFCFDKAASAGQYKDQ